MADKNIVDKIWKFFTSVKLAVVIIAVIALSSMIGTVIEQDSSPEKNLKLFTKIFGPANAQTVYKSAVALGLTDMYHSWWFTSILICFSANLIICSIDKLPHIKRIVDEPLKPIDAKDFDNYGIKKELSVDGSIEDAKTLVLAAIKKLGMTPNASDNSGPNTIQFYAHKGRRTRYAVYVIHFSIIIILIGAVIGNTLGFSGYLILPEGETSAVAYSRQSEKEHPLGFSIRCDDFSTSFYGLSDMPKDYASWLSVIEDGKTVLKKTIGVNSPLKYKGYTFYQSSYGVVPQKNTRSLIILNVTPKGGKTEQISLGVGESFKIPGTKFSGRLIAFTPALAFDKNERPYSYTENMNNPAVYIELTSEDNDKYSGWLVKRYPQTWDLPDGSKVELVDNWGYQYTGLQVRKDPGVLLVYAGCLFMTIGLYCAFFLSHKKIWVLLQSEKTKVNIKIAAFANKNKTGYEGVINSVFNRLTH
ncbi:cytochrome c biogenesis protein ResB [Candidatus Magnetominusculus xianensis]|uniref:Cytochrome C biogenesis protein ResB n=1 Tax=Candidatus Magnetominusculus xianensis TaxID=1748249 RepID=A0ABR5SDB3_9BACT|nr:cytochrome c biogenesis protein ResB [Candidatus Magnetominusculus xianensis]KWT82941.1 cytochrome C biogenesis protein ResB [Candidatus Magnetominusculus xianensis]MBF0403020.1 cytochrome c biogenesis protein ResB [Nitrospirota bacterium]